MFGYQENELDKILLKISENAVDGRGFDGISDSAELRAAHAIEDYSKHRTVAAIAEGLKKRGIELSENELIGAYVDGVQSIPKIDFNSPLNHGKPYKI